MIQRSHVRVHDRATDAFKSFTEVLPNQFALMEQSVLVFSSVISVMEISRIPYFFAGYNLCILTAGTGGHGLCSWSGTEMMCSFL